jgi:hypothetical protein
MITQEGYIHVHMSYMVRIIYVGLHICIGFEKKYIPLKFRRQHLSNCLRFVFYLRNLELKAKNNDLYF